MQNAFDRLVAMIGLVLLSPVFAVIGVAIKRDSPGPVLFTQERVGRFGKPFTLFKFRTMVVDSGKGLAVTAAGDARVTRVGTKLRSTKLDELPQLMNVAKGEMALVGPRPEVRDYVDLWTEQQRQVILSVRPGITDPMTVRLRREEELLGTAADPERYYRQVLLPQKAHAYADYVQQRSLVGDLRLVLVTLKSIVRD